jgi:hypothetical protein
MMMIAVMTITVMMIGSADDDDDDGFEHRADDGNSGRVVRLRTTGL